MHNQSLVLHWVGGWGSDLCSAKEHSNLDQEFGLLSECSITLDSVQTPGGRLLLSPGDLCL